jgi:hypothetical protein
LYRAVLGECALQGMKLISFCQALNRRDFLAANLTDGHLAGAHGVLADHNGAGAAEAFPATVFCSREFQIRSQYPQECPVAFDIQGCMFSVELKTYRFFHIYALVWNVIADKFYLSGNKNATDSVAFYFGGLI